MGSVGSQTHAAVPVSVCPPSVCPPSVAGEVVIVVEFVVVPSPDPEAEPVLSDACDVPPGPTLVAESGHPSQPQID